MITLYQDNQNNNDWRKLWLVVLIAATLLGLAVTCNAQTRKQTAQVDTVYCNPAYIVKYVSILTQSGKQKTYVIYKDVKNNIQELIPVSATVMDYIKLCEANGIKSTLGIRIRNGQISSIIRYKNKFIVK